MSTTPDVFIIESLDPDDEGNGRFEGGTISHVLKLHGKSPRYSYVRTRRQFKKAVKEFERSGYRYLHLSVHADRDGMETTNQDDISNRELAEMLSPALRDKRLFVSACSMVHRQMAGEVIPRTECLSVVGPRRRITFREAAVFWPAVYHLMFTRDSKRVTRTVLREALLRASILFGVEIGYYATSSQARGYSRDILKI